MIVETIEQTNESPRCALEITLDFHKSLSKESSDVDASTKLILALDTLVSMLEKCGHPKRRIILGKATLEPLMHAGVSFSPELPLISEQIVQDRHHNRIGAFPA